MGSWLRIRFVCGEGAAKNVVSLRMEGRGGEKWEGRDILLKPGVRSKIELLVGCDRRVF